MLLLNEADPLGIRLVKILNSEVFVHLQFSVISVPVIYYFMTRSMKNLRLKV